MNDLSKQQLILLALLVSFVTSLATGIFTVSLMSQAPQEVVQTINNVVERIGAGGMFGEIALVDRSTRAASATAETACTLLAINRNQFISLVRANPVFGASLLKAIAQRMQQLALEVARQPA